MMLRRINYPVVRFRDGIDRLMDNFLENAPSEFPFGVWGHRTFPALNVWEEGDKLLAEAEVPGLKMDDLEVTVQGDELTIKGERQADEEEDVTYHRRERGLGRFSRVIRLPVEVNADKVQATLRDGVLTITLPKAEAVLPRKIEVKG